jgi:hypothetical protein
MMRTTDNETTEGFNMNITKKQITELKALATFGQDGTFWSAKESAPFVKVGAVEINNSVTEGDLIATRITQAGLDFLASLESGKEVKEGVDTSAATHDNGATTEQVAQTKPAPTTGKPMFQIEDNVSIPTGAASRGNSLYPFDALAIGQSFFVSKTEEMPNPAKSLASTVAGANKRYAVETGEVRTNRKGNEVPATRQERQFVVRAVKEGDREGARVWRVAVTGAATAE